MCTAASSLPVAVGVYGGLPSGAAALSASGNKRGMGLGRPTLAGEDLTGADRLGSASEHCH